MSEVAKAEQELAHGIAAAEQQITDVAKRDFLKILAIAGGAVAVGAIAWPFIDALNPNADTLSLSRPIIDIGLIAPNTALRIVWLGLPIYIRKLTDAQIAANQFIVPSTLPDPANYDSRVKPGYETWVVIIGLNTAIPCELLGNDPNDSRGPYDGWSCPCDGSIYDPLGRVRVGPAKTNLAIPKFTFLNDTQIQFG